MKVKNKFKVGDKFQLIGRRLTFVVVKAEVILSGTLPVVAGVSVCGRWKTGAGENDILRA